MYYKAYSRFCIYETYIHTMDVKVEEKLSNSLHSGIVECFENMSITANYQKENFEENLHACDSSTKEDAALVDYEQIDSCKSHPTPDSFMCLKESEQFLNNFDFKVSNKPGSYIKKTVQEHILDGPSSLENKTTGHGTHVFRLTPMVKCCTLKQLEALVEDLTQSVERVSSELVQLLLDNDALQQESDARNIAIEQLLKMTVKINESDLKPIQMSVVLPEEDCDVI